jgi:antitoxin component YwqK of YwqJK toxin-antitoxin module
MGDKVIQCILSLLFLCFLCKPATAQKVREIIIDKGGITKEYNKNPSVIEETYVEDGIRMYTVDSLKMIISIATYKDNELNGICYSFFADVDMLEERGEYRAGKKHGTWYFWNRKGVLLRTEVWRDDKLVSKKLMIKTK